MHVHVTELPLVLNYIKVAFQAKKSSYWPLINECEVEFLLQTFFMVILVRYVMCATEF